MFELAVIILLAILVITVWRRGPFHQRAVARRAVRREQFRQQVAGEGERLHKVYNRDAIRRGNQELGYREAARQRRAEYKGTN